MSIAGAGAAKVQVLQLQVLQVLQVMQVMQVIDQWMISTRTLERSHHGHGRPLIGHHTVHAQARASPAHRLNRHVVSILKINCVPN